MISSANRDPSQRHNPTVCECVCTYTQSVKEEEEEVPEGGQCGVLVCFPVEAPPTIQALLPLAPLWTWARQMEHHM